MKFKVLATLILLVVLGALYIATQESQTSTPNNNDTQGISIH